MNLPQPADTGMGGTGGFWKNYNNTAGGMGAGLGGLISSFFQKDPYAAAQGQINQVPGMAQKYLGPWSETGMQANNDLSGQYSKLLGDPSGFMNWLTQNYQQSPGYQFNVDQATEAANRAAAAGGQLGSGAEQIGLANTVHGLANQDFQQYLQNVLGIYGTGLQGRQGQAQTGFAASQGLNQTMQDFLATQAQLEALKTQRKNDQASGIGSFIGSLSGFIPYLAGA